MNILVTGGAGYIGSHTVRALMKSEEFTPFVFDNLSTGHRESVPEEVAFIEGDIHDIAFVAETMKRYEIDRANIIPIMWKGRFICSWE